MDKPQPRIFQIALERFGVVAEQALHVGGSPVHDWEGAAAVGMHVFRLHQLENSLMELREWGDGDCDESPAPPRRLIASLA
ncbi:MAG: HAD hydrolase-like protein [Chthoniobacteraceae bacterium]